MIDLLVVGAGPIGLAVAVRARLSGLDVTVVDPRQDPIDKACGEGLMPSAVAALAELDVHPGGRAFLGIRYVSPRHEAQAQFRSGPGLGVRRLALQSALAGRAQELAVRRECARVTGVQQYADHVQADVRVDACASPALRIPARWLVAADGLHSQIRRDQNLQRRSDGVLRFGQRRHYAVAPWSDYVEVHWSPSAEAYVTPVAGDLVGVAVLCGRGGRYDDLIRGFPQLYARLAAAECGPVRAAGPLRQRVRARRAGRVLLVGDAAGYVDALTGEGLATGLATAEAAVECVLAERPEDYEQAWSRATRRYRMLTGGLLALTQNDRLRPHVVPAAARLPFVFAYAVNALA